MLSIYRPNQLGSGIQDYSIYIDDKKVCEIGNGEEVKIELEPGKYDITAKTLWFRTKVYPMELHDDEKIIVKGPKYSIWLIFVPSIIYATIVALDMNKHIILISYSILLILSIAVLIMPVVRRNYLKIYKEGIVQQ